MKPEKKSAQSKPAIAIIGMGCLFPRSADVKEFWRLLSRGEDGITEIPPTHWSLKDYYHPNPKHPDHTYCRKGGFLSPISYDPAEFGIPPNILEATDTSQLLGLLVAKKALADAGYGPDREFDRGRVNVVLGATGTQELVIPLGARLGHPIWRKALTDSGIAADKIEEVMGRMADSYVPWQENSFPGLLGNVIAGRITNRLDLGGTNCAVDAACASSLSALNLAILELQAGRCDLSLSGGVDTLNDIFMHMCFSQTGVLSHTSDARPFSEEADGTVLGEGIGILVLKRLGDAEKDGDRIYAVIKSIGSSSDGKSQSIYAPSADGQAKALTAAYAEAGVAPGTVELLEAHGTGTRVGDAVEFTALKNVFKDSRRPGPRCALGSVKSNIGHTKAAAGAAGLIKGALALHHKVLPPTLKVAKPDPKLAIADSPFFLNAKTRPWLGSPHHPRRAGVSAFGFGGSNFHVVLEEYQAQKAAPSWDGMVEIAAFSAKDNGELTSKLRKFMAGLGPRPPFADLARAAAETRRSFASQDNARLLFLLERPADALGAETQPLIQRLSEALTALETGETIKLSGPEVFFGGPEHAGKLAFLFPGQGSQYVFMGTDLACCFPEVQDTLNFCNHLFQAAYPERTQRLSDLIFQIPMAAEEPMDAEEALRSTDVAQPAIGALSLAMLRVLERFGIKPSAVAGHSYGELPALFAAGRLGLEDVVSLSIQRGKYMAGAGDDSGTDKGTMLAVKAPIAELDALIQENHLDVVLANRNAPEQGVLSGSTEAIAAAQKACKAKGYRATRLQVAAAFHSRLVAHAAEPFQTALQEVAFKAGEIPVFSNSTAEPYPMEGDQSRRILGEQLLNPVHFIQQIENMYRLGARTFVEVGPKAVLSGLVGAILKGRDFHAISLDRSAGRKSGLADLAACLCRLAADGHPVALKEWEEPLEAPPKQMMSIPICGVNYRSPVKERPPSKPATAAKAVDAPKPIPSRPITADTPAGAPSREIPAPATKAMPKPAAGPTVNAIPAGQPGQNPFVADALKIVSESLKSMQALQAQTADTHKKFLETQTEATRSLQAMLERTRQLTESAFGLGPAQWPPAHFAAEPHKVVRVQPSAVSSAPRAVSQPVPVQVVVPAPTPPMAEKPKPRPAAATPEIEQALMQVVSELTGYPVEMLSADMDIEADLGIDSIKRVEILSAFEEKMPDLPAVAPEDLASLKTLGQIIAHVAGSLSVQAVTASAAAPAVPPATQPACSKADIEQALMQVVSELTGYPVEMLSADMDIEADLGIDSIKRVEILSAFEEKMPDLPAVAPEDLASLKTLGQIIAHVAGSLSVQAVTASAAAPAVPPATQPACSKADIEQALMQVVSELTGYPVEMLSADMDIEADLGIDSIKRVEILSAFEEKMPDLPAVAPEDLASLKTLGQIIAHVAGAAQGAKVPGPAPQAEVPAARSGFLAATMETETADLPQVARRIVVPLEKPLPSGNKPTLNRERTVYILEDRTGLGQALAADFTGRNIRAELVNPADLQDLSALPTRLVNPGGFVIIPEVDLVTDRFQGTSRWNANDELFLKLAFQWVKALGPALMESGRAGGALLAAVTRLDGCFGFKAEGVVHPLHGGLAGLIKTAAIEWPEVACKAVDVDPAWRDNPAIAACLADELLQSGPVEVGLGPSVRHELELQTAPPPSGRIDLSHKEVVIVTGGARGVTAACAYALAKQVRPAIALLGRSPLPGPEPDWLSPHSEEGAMKKAIMAHEFAGRAVTPIHLEKAYKQHAAEREIRGNLADLKSTGAQIHYYSVDVRDPGAVAKVLERVRREQGSIRGLIHGAGVLEDRFILDKSMEQFNKVFDTKAGGLKVMLEALAQDDLRYLVLFSSVAGRLGNVGQVDYAMANEVLNKLAQQEALRRKKCRVKSINWGPWDGGMVTPSLRREFRKKNIELIPIQAGAMSMLYEMMGDRQTPVEVVIGAGLPAAQAAVAPAEPVAEQNPPALTGQTHQCSFRQSVDLTTYPILGAHILGGRPVVPFALITEWIGHGVLQQNPAAVLQGIDDLRLLAGIKLNCDAREIVLMTGQPEKEAALTKVPVEVRNHSNSEAGTVHARAWVILADQPARPPAFTIPTGIGSAPYPKSMAEAYDEILFHGEQLQGIKEIKAYSEKGMLARLSAAPRPQEWIQSPFRDNWLTDPLVLDAAFQMAILWCHQTLGQVSLPSYCARFRQYAPCFPKEDILAVLEVRHWTDHKMTGDFTFLDSAENVVAQLTGYEAVMDKSLQKAFKPSKAKK